LPTSTQQDAAATGCTAAEHESNALIGKGGNAASSQPISDAFFQNLRELAANSIVDKKLLHVLHR